MKLNRNHSASQAQFQARLEAQRNARKNNVETVDSFPSPPPSGPSLFKSDPGSGFTSVDDIVLAGNLSFENLDNIDFAAFRNNEELGQETYRNVTALVTEFHADRTTPEFKKDVSRVMNARYLQGHGIQVETHLDAKEMRSLRKYFQAETSTYNVADAARSMNSALRNGEKDVESLKLRAERTLFTERGVTENIFDEKFAGLDFKDLKKIRNFSDAWSTSQGGKFLALTRGTDFSEHRDTMAREMLAANGYQHVNSIDLDTVLSLLRDVDAEGPRTNETIKNAVNQELAKGEKDYFVLNIKANQAILQNIGVSKELLNQLAVPDETLAAEYPDTAPRESRAERTKVLRDLLRALPNDERQLALDKLASANTNLIKAESVLSKHFGQRIKDLTGGKVKFAKMGAMQRANFSSALSKLPDELRSETFQGHNVDLKNHLENAIESQFGIQVHREAGVAPDNNASTAPFVKDWTVQGLVDLYNAMSGMSKDGNLPETLVGNSTIAYVEGGSESPSMSVGPTPINQDPTGPWSRPGSNAHQSGTSGYYGMCSPDDKGHDTVYFCDDALLGNNGDSALAVTIGESTIIHEFGHAIQLGGTPGESTEVRTKEQQIAMAEWSALSQWTEPEKVLADGLMGSFEYYYDPTVQVQQRQEVATSYGASDPCEDFAEYTPYFFKAPAVAMGLSAEKFLYLNQMVGQHYTDEQVQDVASELGLDNQALAKAQEVMKQKVRSAPEFAGITSVSA